MKILLIRLRLIGDVVFTTPAIAAVRRAFPDAHLSYLVERHAAPVVAHHPDLDDVLVVDRPNGWRRLAADLSLVRRLRAASFDVAIDFHGGPRASALAWLSGAATRIGYGVAGRAWMYTRVVPRPRELRPRHSVENQWDLLRALTPAIPDQPDRTRHPVRMGVDGAAADAIRHRLRAAGVEPSHEVIVVHVSAGNPFRRWPADAFVSLLVSLSAADPNRRIILSSGPSEADAAHRIGTAAAQRLGSERTGSIVPFGDTTIAEVRALVERAALFVGGDTGPLHVAATTATPIVGIYGPTLAARSAPWRGPSLVTQSVEPGPLPCRPCDQRRCEPGDFRCLTALAPERVAAAAEQALARGRAVREGDRTG